LVKQASAAAKKMPPRMVAIGASAGGLEALGGVLGPIASDFPLPVLVVQHLAPHLISHLAELLRVRTALSVEQAKGGERPLPGHVYIAPPDHHLSVDGGRLRLDREPAVRFSRPSVDVLFGSVARSCADGAIAVVLSGGGSDGTDGARAIRAVGGRVVVQDEKSAVNFGMPGSVVAAGIADAVLPPREIAAYLETESRGG
jgi:two-component system chemotaxis response regulator CheB